MRNRPALVAELERRTTRYTAEELFELFDGAGLMAGVSRNYAQVAQCPQVTDNGLLMDVRADDGRHYRALRSPLAEFGTGSAGFIVSAGAQTAEILGALSAAEAMPTAEAVPTGEAVPAAEAGSAGQTFPAGEEEEGHADWVFG